MIYLLQHLQLENTEVLVPTHEVALKKLVVFVPKESEAEVREALGKAGAGAIGNYSHCSFSAEGTGRFLPEEGSKPTIGELGQLEAVSEVRIETIIPETIEKKVLSAMIKAHPYEEVAYDIYRLDNQGEVLGLGKIGTLAREMTLEEFAEHVKETLDVNRVRVVGDLKAKIKKVAVLGGDGNKYFQAAKFKGADVYVTGDMYYHTAHDAMMIGLNIVDPGHNVEKVMKQGVAAVLTEMCRERKLAVEFIPSKIEYRSLYFSVSVSMKKTQKKHVHGEVIFHFYSLQEIELLKLKHLEKNGQTHIFGLTRFSYLTTLIFGNILFNGVFFSVFQVDSSF